MLHKEQSYVREIADELGIDFEIKHYNFPTISCKEKLNILPSDWKLDRIVKALYFQRDGEKYIGVVTPELDENVKPRKVFPKVLDISGRKAERYWPNSKKIPTGMAFGTCTPFPLISTMSMEISDILIKDYPKINDSLVDISLGGTDKEAFKVSMWLPYEGIYKILKHKFGDRIHKF